MNTISFVKMSGTGNDFVILDNRKKTIAEVDLARFAIYVSPRKTAVGCDGIIFLEERDGLPVMRFFNADGSEAEMCGNGSRCFVHYLAQIGLCEDHVRFHTMAGIIEGWISEAGIRVRLADPTPIVCHEKVTLSSGVCTVYSINTSVPHAVVFVDDLETTDVFGLGRELRQHDIFQPAGTNVNFVSVQSPGKLQVRTYERGVEDETLACGTGSTASALVHASIEGLSGPVSLAVQSGEMLDIHFRKEGEKYTDVCLEGAVSEIYTGNLKFA